MYIWIGSVLVGNVGVSMCTLAWTRDSRCIPENREIQREGTWSRKKRKNWTHMLAKYGLNSSRARASARSFLQ